MVDLQADSGKDMQMQMAAPLRIGMLSLDMHLLSMAEPYPGAQNNSPLYPYC